VDINGIVRNIVVIGPSNCLFVTAPALEGLGIRGMVEIRDGVWDTVGLKCGYV
jgi:hypothetical protein